MTESLIQRSFAAGEISPAMYGRADQVKYQTGLKTCLNMFVKKEGGVANRSGGEFIAEVLDSSSRTYLMKFVFNDAQTYIIEVGDSYMRFIRNGAQIVVGTPAAYNGGTAYAYGDFVVYGGVNYSSRVAANTGNQPDISPTQWYALADDIYEIPTPYAAADLSELQYVQSGDVITIVHPTYPVYELTRTAHTVWTLTAQTFAPTIDAPAGPGATAGAAGSIVYRYKITAVKADSYEESLPSAAAATAAAAVPTAAAPNAVTWTAVTGATEYNVYRETAPGSGTYGFIGVAASNSFNDPGFTPEASITPPISRNPFSTTGEYPSTVSYFQQRLMLANQDNNTERLFGSRTGMFDNFTISSPLQDDDAVTFTIAGKKVQEIRHLVEIGGLIVLTASGEWTVGGDADGILRANQPPNLNQIGYSGSASIAPIIITNSLLFVQARANVVRDLRYEVSGGGGSTYVGRDLTIFASHMFKNKTIERWDYAQIPDSIVWAVRSDGSILGLTYLREHELWGWHRHTTDGTYEEVCVVPEGNEDVRYEIVKRTINGTTKRYIERQKSRSYTDIEVDAVFLDSFLTYDGRNTGSTTLTLSTGAGWTVDDEITITAGVGTPFVAGDVGNWFRLYVTDATTGIEYDIIIEVGTYTDSSHVSGMPQKTVPVTLQGVATTTWTRMVDSVSGLDHLALEPVGVFADGNVVASPNNDDYEARTVTAGGALTLDRCYGIIHVGLPYVSDFASLDLDVAGEQMRDRKKNTTHIDLIVENTRGVFAGPDFDNLSEYQPTPVTDYGGTWPEENGVIEMLIASTWNESGGFVVRQKDPLPITILAAIPAGSIGG